MCEKQDLIEKLHSMIDAEFGTLRAAIVGEYDKLSIRFDDMRVSRDAWRVRAEEAEAELLRRGDRMAKIEHMVETVAGVCDEYRELLGRE